MSRVKPFVFLSRSARDTKELGRRIGRHLCKGDTVLLRGELGSGKTTLVQGVVKGVGARDAALSPTFVIAQSFKGKMPVHHLDFYRLSEKEILGIGVQDYLTGTGAIPKGAVLVEWPEKCRRVWPHERLEIWIRIKGRSQEREMKLIAHGNRFQRLLLSLRRAYEEKNLPIH